MAKINENNLCIPYDLKLIDPSYHMPDDIDLLLEVIVFESFWELLGRKQVIKEAPPYFKKYLSVA